MNKIVKIVGYVLPALVLLTVAIACILALRERPVSIELLGQLEKAQTKKVELEKQKENLQEQFTQIEESIDRCVVAVRELPVYDSEDITKNATASENGERVRTLHSGEVVVREETKEQGYVKVTMEDGQSGYVWNDALISYGRYDASMKSKKVVVIDPGHQGEADNNKEAMGPKSKEEKARVAAGTSGVETKVKESELTMTLALQLEKELVERGYTVVLCRRNQDISISNKERAAIANDVKADAFLRIHADGSEKESSVGCHTICSTEDNKNSDWVPVKESRELAESIIKSYVESTDLNSISKGPKARDDLSGINWSKVPVTILEVGFMTNPEEDKKLNDAAFQVKMVQGMANGIDAFFGVGKTE